MCTYICMWTSTHMRISVHTQVNGTNTLVDLINCFAITLDCYISSLGFSVCVCDVLVCMCTCVFRCVHTCLTEHAGVRGSTWGLLGLLSPLYLFSFEKGPLAEPVTGWFGEAVWSVNSKDLPAPCLHLHNWYYRPHCCEFWKFKPGSLCLCGKHFISWATSPVPVSFSAAKCCFSFNYT